MASSLSCFLNSIDGATEGSASRRLLAKNRMCILLGNLNFKHQSNLKASTDNLGRCVFGSRKSVEEVRTPDGCSRLRSAGNDFAEAEFGESSEEDAIQETIEKSKKLLSMQKEILQKIAERKKLLHTIKDTIDKPVDGGISTQDAPNSRSNSDLSLKSWDTFVESNGTRSESISSGTSSGSKGNSAVDEEYKTSGSSVTSGMDSSEVEDIPASSAEFARHYSYSDNEQSTNSSIGKSPLDLGAVKENEETSNLPAFLLNKASTLQYYKVSEGAPLKEVTNDISVSNPLAGDNAMNILLVAAECAPWSKTGGLGDVIAALPKALARRGHRVMVVAPRYENYPEAQSTGIMKRYKVAGQDIEVSYFHAYIDGVDFVFIDCALFRGIQNNIYGGNRQDILRRMVVFCKAAIEVPWHVPCGGACYGDGNLVFIANDWHTALLPVYLKAYYHDNGLMSYARSALVIHNIAHQGRGPLNEFSFVDLPEHYLDSFRLYDPVGGEHLNIFAAGLKAAHRIVTVSHGYAWELKTQEGGWGLHNIINESDWKLKGIVNGIDTNEWSPQSDVHLKSDGYINYSLDTLHLGKAKCKESLQRELNLPVRKDVPLIGFIGRLDDQKGVDIIGECIPWMMEHDVQLVMLGTGRLDLEKMLREFEYRYHDQVRGWVGFSVKTAHRITAGADILLMPSRFEPCGLNQLYAMKYGTVPVVHAVGGLKDTVLQYDPYNDSGYGWTFDGAEPNKLKEALWNCLLTFREYRQSWEAIQRRGMSQNLSWDRAAEMYEEVVAAAKYQW